MTPAPFPFLVGCGRSGTTLLRAVLDAHPDMAIPGESYFPVWLGRGRRRSYERPGRFDTGAFVADLLADPWFARWDLPADDVRAGLCDPPVTSFADAVRRAYSLYARRQAKARYGDKTPTFVLHVDLLADLFQEARFVHIVRDGRAVALSLLEAPWGPSSVAGAALHWRHHVECGRRSGRRLDPQRYREVRYEELIDDPERIARSLCAFVGLDFDDRMLRYVDQAPALLAGLPDAYEHQNLRLPPTKGLRDWHSQMAGDDLALFEALAGDLLGDLGYDCAAGAPTRPVRLRARRAQAGWQVQRAARRARTLAARAVHR